MSKDDDYSDPLNSRLERYVKAVMTGEDINPRNIDYRYNFVEAGDEAEFLYYLANSDYKGVVNFASSGDISIREVIDYVEKKTGKRAIYSENAKVFPFTNHPEVSMELSICNELGYKPLELKKWLFHSEEGDGKIDDYIKRIINNQD